MSVDSKIDDTFCEAFEGVGVQVLITAARQELLDYAVHGFVARPGIIFGKTEGGIVEAVPETRSPDGRPGTVVQLWAPGTGDAAVQKLKRALGERVRNAIMCVPSTAVFNALPGAQVLGLFDLNETVGRYGDGYQREEIQHERQVVVVPLMSGRDFVVEQYLPYKEGVMGGFFWFLCDTFEAGWRVGRKAIDASLTVEDVGHVFDVCASGSKLTSHDDFGPTTNHRLCPTLRERVPDSQVPAGVASVPEVVLNGFTLGKLKLAMKRVVEATVADPGLVQLTTGNFGGGLGAHKIQLRDLPAFEYEDPHDH